MKYTSITEEQMELIVSVLTDWEREEMSKIAPQNEMLDALRDVRFRSIDVPQKYNADRPWEIESEEPESIVYAINEELGRDAVPRNTHFGFPTVVETSTDYDEEQESVEQLYDDVAEIVGIVHKLGWTLHEYGKDTISLRPAESEHTIDTL